MHVVIVAGGSGTRLWPLSTPNYPKHLLALTNEKSLLQNTIHRAEQLTSTDKILVISEKSHIKHVYNQLEHISKEQILVEPARRGTASCVAFALSHLKKQGVHENEAILIIWADHLIRDMQGFSATTLKAATIAEEKQKVVLIGIDPSYPSTGLGYIKKGKHLEDWLGVYDFAGFVEKPDAKTAKKYYESGEYTWNTGYLVSTLQCFEAEMAKHPDALHARYRALLDSTNTDEAYQNLDSIALEYDFSELLKEGVVIPGAFDWLDIGSFQDLHAVSPQNDEGNYVFGDKVYIEHTTNSYIRNESDVNVVIVGLDNVVIVHNKNGILVTNKNYAQKVGDIARTLS